MMRTKPTKKKNTVLTQQDGGHEGSKDTIKKEAGTSVNRKRHENQ